MLRRRSSGVNVNIRARNWCTLRGQSVRVSCAKLSQQWRRQQTGGIAAHRHLRLTLYPLVALAPGIGYYQVNNSLPGPGIPTVAGKTATGVRLGAEIGLGEGYRSWRAGANDNVGLRHFGSLHARLCFAAEKDRQVDAVRRLRVSSPAQFLPRRPGKVVEVDGVPVTAVNANAGSETRNHFLHALLKQDEDRYTAYWTVRSCNGEGACGEVLQLFEKIFSAGLYVQKPPNGARIAHSFDERRLVHKAK
jgi:hypothetical protein